MPATTISSGMAKYLFTKDLFDVINVMPPMGRFLLKKFAFEYRPTTYIAWQQRRWAEKLASTVIKGTDGNLNKATLLTEQIEEAPQFHEKLNITNLRGYNSAFGTNSPTASAVDDLLTELALEVQMVKDTIVRSYNLMAAQIMQTGTVTTNTFTYDFGRNAASFADLGAGNYWDNNSVNPITILESGATFCRQYGKTSDSISDVIMGASAFNAFLENTKTLDRSQKLWSILTDIEKPQMGADGECFQGRISAGAYQFNIWTYPQFYTASTEYQPAVTLQTNYGSKSQSATPNTSTKYIDDTNIIIMPSNTVQLWASTLVPRLPEQVNGTMSTMGMAGETDGGLFFAYDYQDVKRTAWEFNIKSSGLTIPVRIDDFFTAKVMGS